MRKIAANYIFPVVKEPLQNGMLVLDDEGTVIDLMDGSTGFREQENVEFYNGIIVPGFVNAHCHLELSYLKGEIPRNTGLPGFLEHFVKLRKSDPETLIPPAREAHMLMERAGIVAVGDITNTPHTFDIKESNRILYHSFIEIWGNDPDQAAGILLKGIDLLNFYQSGKKQSASLTLHSTYTVSDTLFYKIREYTHGGRNTISIHNQETASEDELFYANRGELKKVLEQLGDDLSGFKTGKDSAVIATLQKLPKDQVILLIHNTYTSEKDILEAEKAHSSLFWVLCPGANLFIENRLPDISCFSKQDIVVALGTDSLASNDDLSILKEMQRISRYFPDIELESLLQWGTLNGARALGLDKSLGSFETGKKPGVNLIEHIDFDRMALKETSSVRVLM